MRAISAMDLIITVWIMKLVATPNSFTYIYKVQFLLVSMEELTKEQEDFLLELWREDGRL